MNKWKDRQRVITNGQTKTDTRTVRWSDTWTYWQTGTPDRHLSRQAGPWTEDWKDAQMGGWTDQIAIWNWELKIKKLWDELEINSAPKNWISEWIKLILFPNRNLVGKKFLLDTVRALAFGQPTFGRHDVLPTSLLVFKTLCRPVSFKCHSVQRFLT